MQTSSTRRKPARTLLRVALSQVSLSSLLQLLETDHLTGILQLPSGELLLREGYVIGARCGELQGVTALMQLFLGTSGAAQFVAEDPGPGTALGSACELTLQACQLLDDWTFVRGKVLLPTGPVDDPALLPLLPWLDGTATVFEAAALANVPSAVYAPVLATRLRAGQFRQQLPEKSLVVELLLKEARQDEPPELGSTTASVETLQAENRALREQLETLEARLKELEIRPAPSPGRAQLLAALQNLRETITTSVDESYRTAQGY